MVRATIKATGQRTGFAFCLVLALLFAWVLGPKAPLALPKAGVAAQTLALTPTPDLAATLVKTSLKPRATEDRPATGPDLALVLAAVAQAAVPALAVQDQARPHLALTGPAHARPEPRAPPAA